MLCDLKIYQASAFSALFSSIYLLFKVHSGALLLERPIKWRIGLCLFSELRHSPG